MFMNFWIIFEFLISDKCIDFIEESIEEGSNYFEILFSEVRELFDILLKSIIFYLYRYK